MMGGRVKGDALREPPVFLKMSQHLEDFSLMFFFVLSFGGMGNIFIISIPIACRFIDLLLKKELRINRSSA